MDVAEDHESVGKIAIRLFAEELLKNAEHFQRPPNRVRKSGVDHPRAGGPTSSIKGEKIAIQRHDDPVQSHSKSLNLDVGHRGELQRLKRNDIQAERSCERSSNFGGEVSVEEKAMRHLSGFAFFITDAVFPKFACGIDIREGEQRIVVDDFSGSEARVEEIEHEFD